MERKESICANKKVWNALFYRAKNIIYTRSQINKNSTLLKFYFHTDNYSIFYKVIKYISKGRIISSLLSQTYDISVTGGKDAMYDCLILAKKIA